MEIILIVLSGIITVLLVVLLLRKPPGQDLQPLYQALVDEMNRQQGAMKNDMTNMVATLNRSNLEAMETLGSQLRSSQKQAGDDLLRQENQMNETLLGQVDLMSQTLLRQVDLMRQTLLRQVDLMSQTLLKQVNQMETANAEQIFKLQQGTSAQLENMRVMIGDSMKNLCEENSRKLDEIRGTVDEKLQTTLEKRITESFRTVSTQLEAVYKELGEMHSLATDVGGLKKVLSGVKTRGILGEYQAGAILAEILTQDQYAVNVETVPGTGKRVEFAVKLPGAAGSVWLPIDSKFPGERYQHLLDAQDTGDKAQIEAAYKDLEAVITAEARDISEKYVQVPYTTNFGIMFLPFEGLYAEVVNRKLLDQLQTRYHVNVAGPSTLAALLNSLQMGFRTLAIQKKSAEVWETLANVKSEFDKFEEVMVKMQKHLNQTSSDLENLMGTRTRAIQRRLRGVELPDAEGSDKFRGVELPDAEGSDKFRGVELPDAENADKFRGVELPDADLPDSEDPDQLPSPAFLSAADEDAQ